MALKQLTRGRGRANRDLRLLRKSSSTARVLNLVDLYFKLGEDPDYLAEPMFRCNVLNRSIILKHRLRSNELDAFEDGRSTATKVILPINIYDFSSGARTFFVGQNGYEEILEDLLGRESAPNARRDMQLLRVLDKLPSLDPFLSRERLKQAGFQPARCYFEISEGDTKRMMNFVRREILPLIGMSFDDLGVGLDDRSTKFVQKIMDNAADAELEPFRVGMGLDHAAFQEGVFCWKGFIYYKWVLGELVPQVRPISAEISKCTPVGPVSDAERAFIIDSRARLVKSIGYTCQTVRESLKVYDDAYADLTRNGKPIAFREFLLSAPFLFNTLGERLGALQHIISFWRYRFPLDKRRTVDAAEMVDLLADFEFSLHIPTEG